MRVRLQIENAAEVRQRVRALGPRAIAALHGAALAGAEVVREAAAARAPRRTGFLAAHIAAEVVEARPERVVVAIGPDREAFYGLFVERGHPIVMGSKKATRRVLGQVPPHPWLEPAFDESRREAAQRAIEMLRRELLS